MWLSRVASTSRAEVRDPVGSSPQDAARPQPPWGARAPPCPHSSSCPRWLQQGPQFWPETLAVARPPWSARPQLQGGVKSDLVLCRAFAVTSGFLE